MREFEPIEITPSFYQLGTPFFPVYLSIGDDPQEIAQEKAGWVLTIADHMPYKMMAPPCRVLINHSEAEAKLPDLSFEL